MDKAIMGSKVNLILRRFIILHMFASSWAKALGWSMVDSRSS